MKTFLEIREAKNKPVVSKKIGKIKMSVMKEPKGFTVYVDGDKIDTYKSQREAEKAGTTFIKQYRGMR
tara:strand:+ start:659 stop:862 length:204 start_codon:yes stop_codon:yes gene_type:complete